jgi:hypothetical protein
MDDRRLHLFLLAARKERTGIEKACSKMSRRDGAIVAWHEVPGQAPTPKSRPVGYGVIRAGFRATSMKCIDD